MTRVVAVMVVVVVTLIEAHDRFRCRVMAAVGLECILSVKTVF